MNIKHETKLNELSDEAKAQPFCNLLPTDEESLLRWKIYVRERCLEDREFRETIRQCCAADVCFWAATFGWFHETRETERVIGKFPLILDPDQIDILAWLQKYGGRIDVVIEKTRGVGLSYLICLYCLWLWLFRSQKIDIGLLSKDKNALDILDRPSTLMGKLDTIFAELPAWMRLDENGKTILHRTSSQTHLFENLLNGNCIIGFVPTDQKLRSARLYCLFADEGAFLDVTDQRWLAAATGTSPSIIWVSTHNGSNTMFFRLVHDEVSDLIRISTFWWNNRRCARGMYKIVNGLVVKIDKDYKFEEGYQYNYDKPGRLQSPFTDRAFRRPQINPLTVEEELYGIAATLSKRMYREKLVKYLELLCAKHVYRCDMVAGEFIENDEDNPELYFWEHAEVFDGYYVIGVDPAAGVEDGAYAALVAINVRTGQQVVSAALKDMSPIPFAQYVVALAKRLAGPRGHGFAKIAFESTGAVGAQFAAELNRLRWSAVCFDGKKTTPGFHNSDNGEGWLLELARALQDNDIVIKDRRIIQDLAHFEYDSKWELEYVGKDGHGDLGIAAALAWQGAKDMRQAILRQQKATRSNAASIENEPKYQERRNKNKLYSTRFRGS
jgi:hypothetical protein